MIERAKFILKAKTDKELAEKLNVIPSVVGGWKQRGGHIPLPHLIEIAAQTGVSLDWLILGKGQPKSGVVFYSAPDVLVMDIPIAEKIRLLSDWHIEQLRELNWRQMQEESKQP